MAGNNVPGLERCLLHAPGFLLGFCRDKNSWMSEIPLLLMFLKGMVVEHQINNGDDPSMAKLVPMQSLHGIRSKQEVPWGGEGWGRKRREVKPSHALMWDFPQHSSPGISYSSARHLRREARNKPCSSGYPSIDYNFSMAYFPFLFFPTRCLTQYILINAKKGKIHALQH